MRGRVAARLARDHIAAAYLLSLMLLACTPEGDTPGSGEDAGPVSGKDTVFYQEASWSPNGEYLLFSVFHRDKYHIELAAVFDTTYSRLTFGKTSDCWASWAPDNRKFVFESRSGGHSRIDLSDIEDRNRTTITPDSIEAKTPSWSPDGQSIAFSMQADSLWQIALMDPDGRNIRVIGAGVGSEYNPRWSPDSKWLVYYAKTHDTDWVFTVRIDGSERTKLVPGVFPDVSPDGSKIVFNNGHNVFVMNRNGTNVTFFLENGFAARWKPNEPGYFAFVRGRWPQSEVNIAGPAGKFIFCISCFKRERKDTMSFLRL